MNWALARQCDWRVILRIEDLDGPRVKPGAAESTTDTLRWLGLDWDIGPLVQSADLGPYRDAARTLAARALAYPCDLSRTEIEAAASAPQQGAHDTPFHASLRPPLVPLPFDPQGANWRFATPSGPVAFRDGFAGPQVLEPERTIGDFVIWTRHDQPAYQLAVVVDDARQGVTQVVRGDDLLDSAARQLLLYRALGLSPEPAYTHLPLVRGPDGRRLAKRHGDTRLDYFRDRGVPPERIVGLLAHWSGITGPPRPMSATEFRHRFDLPTMPREPIIHTPKEDQWLLNRP